MLQFTASCDFEGRLSPFHIYVGEPCPNKHPLEEQMKWLSRERKGTVSAKVSDGFEEMHSIARRYHISLEELCAYAWGNHPVSSSQEEGELTQLMSEANRLEMPAIATIVIDIDTRNTTQASRTTAEMSDGAWREANGNTFNSIYEAAAALFSDSDAQSSLSRLLYVAIGLYITVLPDKNASPNEVYKIVNSDDLSYSIAVSIDTYGKFLSKLAYSLLTRWLYCDKHLRDATILHMNACFLDFFMSRKPRDERTSVLHSSVHEIFSQLLKEH